MLIFRCHVKIHLLTSIYSYGLCSFFLGPVVQSMVKLNWFVKRSTCLFNVLPLYSQIHWNILLENKREAFALQIIKTSHIFSTKNVGIFHI